MRYDGGLVDGGDPRHGFECQVTVLDLTVIIFIQKDCAEITSNNSSVLKYHSSIGAAFELLVEIFKNVR